MQMSVPTDTLELLKFWTEIMKKNKPVAEVVEALQKIVTDEKSSPQAV